MGAELIYERRFAQKSTSDEQAHQRTECVKKAAEDSVSASGSYGGFSGYVDAKWGSQSDACDSSSEQ